MDAIAITTWALLATATSGPMVRAARPLNVPRGGGTSQTVNGGDPVSRPPAPDAEDSAAVCAANGDGDSACVQPGDGAAAEAGFPEDWEEFTYADIREHFDCGSRSADGDKPLPRLEDWELMQRTYTRVIDPDHAWDDPVPPTAGYSFVKGVPEPPPYYPKFSPGKGRGLFASRDIAKGTLVHDGHADVVFPTATDWRRFVFSLPPDLSCDCTDWHWLQRFREGGPYVMLGGINISSLMNSGGEEYGLGRMPNALPEDEFSGKFLATRDIKKDEEILTDYYAYPTDFSLVGL